MIRLTGKNLARLQEEDRKIEEIEQARHSAFHTKYYQKNRDKIREYQQKLRMSKQT